MFTSLVTDERMDRLRTLCLGLPVWLGRLRHRTSHVCSKPLANTTEHTHTVTLFHLLLPYGNGTYKFAVCVCVCLSVCLSTCDASPPKLLNGFGQNFAQGWRSMLDTVSCSLVATALDILTALGT